MTTQNNPIEENTCPVQNLLKTLSGKWKMEVFKLTTCGPVRFNNLLRQLKGSNKQSLSIALKELEDTALIEKIVVKKKPLHIEYHLTETGKNLIPVFLQLEKII